MFTEKLLFGKETIISNATKSKGNSKELTVLDTIMIFLMKLRDKNIERGQIYEAIIGKVEDLNIIKDG